MAISDERAITPTGQGEEVDGVVIGTTRALPARRPQAQLVAAQAAVVAGSFVAGAATAVVMARRGRSASRRSRRKGGKPQIAATRSFLVDVHLLDR